MGYPKGLFFFTLFDFSTNKKQILRNNYSCINKRSFNFSSKTFFVGQPLEDLIDDKDYYKILKSIKLKYDELAYVAHRKDPISKINYIKNVLQIDVIILNDIIEIYLIKMGLLPKNVISFFSTSLISIKHLFKENIEVKYVYHDNMIDNDLILVFNKFSIPKEF